MNKLDSVQQQLESIQKILEITELDKRVSMMRLKLGWLVRLKTNYKIRDGLKMENAFKHNKDGTTSIFMTYLDEEIEVAISSTKFDKVSSIDGKWRTWWDFDSRTYYVAYTDSDGNTVYLHRYITDCPKGMQVHHVDGNGLNNTDENLSVINRKEHSLETKKKQRKPFIGDPSLGVELHFLSEAVNTPNGKKHFRLKINGIPFKAMSDDMEGHLRKWIADEIMNRNASDEQIFAYLLSAGYRDRDFCNGYYRRYSEIR
ncbi:HNH endonuclease [Bacillus sp. sid0103]|uniref:HNH endonuclease n=1 Tax=Bacillus sp. sid0103 TaxID=2856337 RepID=UPI001C482777|nr:HNH endonuclease [Bacillus sp. sid0103]MBV7507878.1 HNH endonuclease [Bacillus sp. sid0103]